MGKRRTVTAESVAAVAAENAGHPLERERAAMLAESLETILQQMDLLRSLPLKEEEPALIYRPAEGRSKEGRPKEEQRR